MLTTMNLALRACQVDLATGQVVKDGVATVLTTRETDLLRYLVDHAGEVVTRDQILERVYGYADVVVSRACDNTVRRLRTKLEADAAAPDHLLTAWGTGYRFVLGGSPAPPPEPPPDGPRELVAFGPVRLDLDRRRVLGPDGDQPLSESEAGLLDALLRADGRVVDRRTLIAAIRESRTAGAERALDNTIRALRTKIEPDPSEPRFLHTARGTGYRLDRPPDRRHDPDLVGRASIAAAALAALDDARWVLLVGPGGVGKSRLARHLADRADRPAVWVDVAVVRTFAEGAAVVARALGIDVGAADPIEAIRAALARRSRVLVILDNLEQAPASLVAALLWAAPDVRWLGTSRVRLGVEGERVVEVLPLDTDDAATLFVRRVAAAAPGRARLPPDHPGVQELVERVDRLPLALELAAPRLRVLDLDQLLARLRPDLLVATTAVDPRHRSIRVVIEASLEALPEVGLRALRQIALFVRGLFVEDAEGLLGPDAIDLLQLLRDHSLLETIPDDTGPRFATWHLVREVLGVDSTLVEAHCAWLARHGDRDPLRELEVSDATARHRALLDELVAATRLALAGGYPILAARCALGAVWTFAAQGPHEAGIALLDEVLAAAIPAPLRAELLERRGFLRVNTGRSAEATDDFVAAAGLAGEHGPSRVAWTALHRWSNQLMYAGRREEGRRLLDRAIADAEADASPMAWFYEGLQAWQDGDPDRAEVLLTRCVDGDLGIGVRTYALERLADLARADARLELARDRLDQAWEIRTALGQAMERYNLVPAALEIAHEIGDPEAVAQWAATGRELGQALPNPGVEAAILVRVARAALWRGRLAEAAATLDQAEALGDVHALLRGVVADVRAEWWTASGDLVAAAEAARQAIDGYRSVGNAVAAGLAERHLARERLVAGDVAAARVHAERMPDDPLRTATLIAIGDERPRPTAWPGTELSWALSWADTTPFRP